MNSVKLSSVVRHTGRALASHGARHILMANLPDLGLTPFGLVNSLNSLVRASSR
jgi:phospholipase/lecithinase/hemolysin